jgi:hypothetical protein
VGRQTASGTPNPKRQRTGKRILQISKVPICGQCATWTAPLLRGFRATCTSRYQHPPTILDLSCAPVTGANDHKSGTYRYDFSFIYHFARMADLMVNGHSQIEIPAPPVDPVERLPTPPPPPPDSIVPPPPPESIIPPPPEDPVPPPPAPALAPSTDDVLASVVTKPSKKKAGWGSQAKVVPLSVEELLRKKREADEAAAKVRRILRALHKSPESPRRISDQLFK